MSPTLQKRRRTDRCRNAFASVAVALSLALLLAACLEAMLFAIGLVMGGGNRHPGWGDVRLPGPGPWRDMVLLASVLFVPCLWVGARVGPTFIARFDDTVLRPDPPAAPGSKRTGPLSAAQQRAWRALESWCRAGVGEGRTPFWHPWRLPDVPERFSLAVMVGEDDAGKSHLAEAFARHLDRNDELAALSAASRLKGWRLKLAVKWHELWWWRKRHPRQPWDCGHLAEDPAAKARLAHFRPRRPTLIIAEALSDGSLEQVVRAFRAASADYRHPVRLLVTGVALPGTPELRFDAGARRWHAPAHDPGRLAVIDLAAIP